MNSRWLVIYGIIVSIGLFSPANAQQLGYSADMGFSGPYTEQGDIWDYVSEKGLDITEDLSVRGIRNVIWEDEVRATLNYSAFGSVRARNHRISGRLEGTIEGSSNFSDWAHGSIASPMSSYLNVTYKDRGQLIYHGDGDIPGIASQGLRGKFRVDGALFADLNWETLTGDVRWYADAAVEVYGPGQGFSAVAHAYGNTGLPHVAGTVAASYAYFDYGVDSSLRFNADVGINLGTRLTYGEVGVLFEHTLEFESLIFADGSTPESHGFEVVLESGLPSPNLVGDVPEPSAFALLGIASIIATQLRRKRSR